MTQQVKTRALIVIRDDRCKSCGWCVAHCPQSSLAISARTNAQGHHPVELIDPERCTGCGQCALVCPDVCIEVYRRKRSG